MKEEPTEPNRNDNYIKHRIVSWYGEHKMLTRLLILGILIIGFSGGYWYQEQPAFDIRAQISPTTEAKNQRMTLTVTIIPKEEIKGIFQIEIKPQDTSNIFLTENIPLSEETKSWFVNIGELNLRVGENRPFVYYVSATCPSISAEWWIDINVKYKPEGEEDFTETHSKRLIFKVSEGEESGDSYSVAESPPAGIILTFLLGMGVGIIVGRTSKKGKGKKKN